MENDFKLLLVNMSVMFFGVVILAIALSPQADPIIRIGAVVMGVVGFAVIAIMKRTLWKRG